MLVDAVGPGTLWLCPRVLGQELGDGTQGQLVSAQGVWAPVGRLEAGG